MLPSAVPPKPSLVSGKPMRPRGLVLRAISGIPDLRTVMLAWRHEETGVLKNINSLLTPELLATLRAMGHGDELAIVDANYPAVSSGVPVIRLDGASTTQTLDAVLSVLPLDE